MQFPKIHLSKEILDIILNQLKKDKQNKNVFRYIDQFQKKITDYYLSILNKLPDYTKMEPFYKLMSQNIVPYTTMEKYKNHYLATIKIINKISENYKNKCKNERDFSKRDKLKKEFLGRITSVIKKLDSTNKKLIECSQEFKRIPNPKKLFTIVIVGLPNTGKTTLLTKITDANPEINSYAFTTKALNFGYFKKREEIIQVIDTPGLIHKEFKEMNTIEKQAIVAIKTIANIIIFVYDEYQDIQTQKEMLEKIKEENQNKQILVYSKTGKQILDEPHITIEQILNKQFKC
ncbi:MAG TPA: 50S ribosome-binding GTPase [archaeon]|jgi:nucleolar GTP-binding protein|nr:MAG: GTPase CgtA [archaeon ADurb.Bin336]HPC09983.1 50S ribosome-binding GTPase [archaeon]HRT03037.1 50S ribosome-binding GTPase [Candidatus Diapherotrites archaeon]